MSTTDPSDIEAHANVLYRHDPCQRIIGINEPGDESPPPWLFLARGPAETLLRFGIGVPDGMVAACEGALRSLDPWDGARTHGAAFEPLRDAVRTLAPIGGEWNGPAYRFGALQPDGAEGSVRIDETNALVLQAHFPSLVSHVSWRRPVFGVIDHDVAVSVCFSARRDDIAAEAGVETAESHRGRGLAIQVAQAWAADIAAEGLRPLYSTSWDNAASQAVARKLGLTIYAETFSIR